MRRNNVSSVSVCPAGREIRDRLMLDKAVKIRGGTKHFPVSDRRYYAVRTQGDILTAAPQMLYSDDVNQAVMLLYGKEYQVCE